MDQESSAATRESFVESSENAVQLDQILRCRLRHRVRDLQVWSEPHGFVLSGCSHSYYDKQMAQQIVKEISGLGIADNRIVVDSRAMDANPAYTSAFPRHATHAAEAGRIHRSPHRRRLSH